MGHASSPVGSGGDFWANTFGQTMFPMLLSIGTMMQIEISVFANMPRYSRLEYDRFGISLLGGRVLRELAGWRVLPTNVQGGEFHKGRRFHSMWRGSSKRI